MPTRPRMPAPLLTRRGPRRRGGLRPTTRLVRAHQPPASRISRCRTRAATTRRYSAVERTSSIGMQLAGERLGGEVGGLGRRRSALEDGLGRARHGSASPPRTRARAGPTSQAVAGAAVAPGEGHHDLADRLGASRPDLAEPDLSRPGAMGTRIRRISSSSARAVRRYAGQKASAGTTRSPRALPSTNSASIASRTGSVSPAGEALAAFPPSVPRFWIWAAPIVAAACDQPGEMLAAHRRATDLGVGGQGAQDDGLAVERDAAQRVEPPQVDDPGRRLARARRSARPSGRCRRRWPARAGRSAHPRARA